MGFYLLNLNSLLNLIGARRILEDLGISMNNLFQYLMLRAGFSLMQVGLAVYSHVEPGQSLMSYLELLMILAPSTLSSQMVKR